MNTYRELMIGCGQRRTKDARLPTAEELREHMSAQMSGVNIRAMNLLERKGLEFQNLTTLDKNPAHRPDIIHDLTIIPFLYRALPPMPNQNDPKFIVRNSAGDINQPASHTRYEDAWRDWDAYRDNSIMEDNYFDEIHAYEVLEHTGQQGDYAFFFKQFTEFHRILKPGGFFFGTCPAWYSAAAWGDPSHTRVLTAMTLSFLSQQEYAEQVGKTQMSDFRYLYKADFRGIYVHEKTESLLFALQAIK